jgi:hypothetical protein
MNTVKIQIPRAKSRRNRVLFDPAGPLQPRREQPRVVYNRRIKHPKRSEDDTGL